MLRRKTRVPEELRAVDAALRDSRPRLSDQRMARLLADATGTAAGASSTPRKDPFVRSRLAIVTMLVLGLFGSLSGASLAVSGFAGGGATASQAQYQQPSSTPTTPDQSGTLGEVQGGGTNETTQNNGSSGGGVQNEIAGGGPTTTSEQGAAAPSQVAAETSGGTLPFTGWAAIPVLVAGLALLGTGLVLRRSTRRN